MPRPVAASHHLVWGNIRAGGDDFREHHVQNCDVLLVIGTSGVVHPAAGYPLMAAENGVPVIEVNLEKTPLSEVATICLLGKAGN